MESLHRAGGWAAIVMSVTYIAGFGIFLGLLDRTGYEGAAGNLAFALDNTAILSLAMTLLYLVFGAALVTLVTALEGIASGRWPPTAKIASGFGMVWAGLVLACGMIALVGLTAIAGLAETEAEHAATVWTTLGIVQNGLGGGIELVGGLWSMVVSWAMLRDKAFPRSLGWLGMTIGLAGIATVVPAFRELAPVFGLAQIVWFAWLGLFLLRSKNLTELT